MTAAFECYIFRVCFCGFLNDGEYARLHVPLIKLFRLLTDVMRFVAAAYTNWLHERIFFAVPDWQYMIYTFGFWYITPNEKKQER